MKHNLSEIVEYINTDNVRFKEPYIEKRNIKVGNFYIIALYIRESYISDEYLINWIRFSLR